MYDEVIDSLNWHGITQPLLSIDPNIYIGKEMQNPQDQVFSLQNKDFSLQDKGFSLQLSFQSPDQRF